jgi:hypothetical protein
MRVMEGAGTSGAARGLRVGYSDEEQPWAGKDKQTSSGHKAPK